MIGGKKMNEIMNVVPNMISGKDLDYLSDIFNWNYVLAKKVNSYADLVSDEEIKNIFTTIFDTCMRNLNGVLDVLNMKGETYEQQ